MRRLMALLTVVLFSGCHAMDCGEPVPRPAFTWDDRGDRRPIRRQLGKASDCATETVDRVAHGVANTAACAVAIPIATVASVHELVTGDCP